jgi:stage V sporulation protein G
VVITEVRIKLMEDHNENERLQAFCSVTFDNAFVVRDLKIIEGTKGSFVAMPSRKLTDRCMQCGCKNHLRARFCNQCGAKLDEDRATRDADGRAKLHADIAHPINSACREVIQTAVIRAYQEERERSKQPGYVSNYDDYESDYEESYTNLIGELNASGRGGEFRAHPAHGSRGGHAARHTTGQESARPVTSSRDEGRAEGFGAGIL